MEELKVLVDMVAHLPQMALWVIAFFFVYKVTVIGSIYGVIRFVTSSLFSWLTSKKVDYKEIRPMLDGICISGTVNGLMTQLHRVKGKGTGINSDYIHKQSVDWLREAIDAKIALEEETTKKGK